MIKSGIRYISSLDINTACKNGFDEFEADYNDVEELKKKLIKNAKITGISVKLKELDNDKFKNLLKAAYENKCRYIVINTIDCNDSDKLLNIIKNCTEDIKKYSINICIENSFVVKMERYLYGNFSDAESLKKLTDMLNNITQTSLFGVCIDIGYANMLGTNIRSFIESIGNRIKLMHMNDNNGESVQYQMPYTFTTGRGTLSTDWYRIIGSLVRLNYNGEIVFNITGTINRVPAKLQETMLKLLKAIKEEWNEQFEFEDKLKNSNNIILFGAGKMAQNYMEEWGERYKPAFFADNNSNNWGSVRMGVEVKSPDEILKIDESERLVLICNLFYDAIGEQLDGMGIKYGCYWDHYYL